MSSIRGFGMRIGFGLSLAAAAWAAQAPVIISVEPARIPPAGGVRVIIAGEHFRPGAVVRLCGEAVVDATWVTENQIEFVAPRHAAGACDVAVENQDGQTARMPTLFAYSQPVAPEPTVFGSYRPLGAPMVPLAQPAPAPPAAPAPAAPPVDPATPERTAAEFMARVIRKDDTVSLHHPRMRSPLPTGVTFGWQFSEGFLGTFAGVPIAHYEGRLESINGGGLRAWFPFVLHVTRERPSTVTGFAVSTDPLASRQSLVAAIEAEQSTDVLLNTEQPLRPLP